jgi:hypothetical protein
MLLDSCLTMYAEFWHQHDDPPVMSGGLAGSMMTSAFGAEQEMEGLTATLCTCTALLAASSPLHTATMGAPVKLAPSICRRCSPSTTQWHPVSQVWRFCRLQHNQPCNGAIPCGHRAVGLASAAGKRLCLRASLLCTLCCERQALSRRWTVLRLCLRLRHALLQVYREPVQMRIHLHSSFVTSSSLAQLQNVLSVPALGAARVR